MITLEIWFFCRDMTYPHIDQNGISGKSAKNAPTSRPHNFVKNGRTRLVYDSFWSQGPPKLQKTGLGWFPQLARPLRADLRIFPIFSKISPGQPISKKVIFLTSESEKMIENDFFQIFDFPKNMELQLQNGIFTSVVLPIDQKRQGSEILMNTFKE